MNQPGNLLPTGQDPVNPSSRQITTSSANQTRRLGRRLGELLTGGQVIALIGPLGAGKTQLVKGIAGGLGWADPHEVTSPTFVLVNEYVGRLHLYHIDAYRLAGSPALEALGFDEMIAAESAVVIEWADKVTEALPDDRLTIRIHPTAQTVRRFTLSGSGPLSQTLANALPTQQQHNDPDG